MNMIKKILFFIFIALATWKILSVAQIEIPFLENFSNKNAGFAGMTKPKTAPECAEHMKYQKFDSAAACYKKALANDKANPEIIFFLAYSLYQNKDYKSAIFYTNFITKNFPKSKFAVPAFTLNTKANADLRQREQLQNYDKDDYFDDIKPSRWVRMPIRVWIQHTDNNANLKNAFYTWQNALYPTVSFEMVNRKEDAQLTVVFGNPPSKCSMDNAIGCALTYSYSSNHSLIPKAEIYLARFAKSGKRLSDNDVYGVLVHEIGHAIGITGGHSKNKSDVMYPSSDNYNLRPTRRDINTVKKIYSSIELY